MNELKTLFRQSSHYFAGRVGVILLGFISFPLFTRLFSVADYGLMGLVLKVTAIFIALSKLGLQNSALRFYQEHAAAGDRTALRRYFSTLFFGSAGVAAFVMLVFLAGIWVMPATLVTLGVKKLLSFAAILIVTGGMCSIISGFLQVEERTKTYNVLDVAQKAGTIAAVCGFFIFWRSNVWAFFAGTILLEVMVTLGMTLYLAGRRLLVPKLVQWDLLRTSILFGAPLVIYEFSSLVLDAGDRVFVQHYLGAQQLGYYSAAYNLAAYLQISIMAPLNLALFPIYMRLWVNKGKEETQAFIGKCLYLYTLLIIGVMAAATVTSGAMVTVLASAKYRAAQNLLPILVAGVLIYSVHIFLNAGLLIHKKTAVMARLVVYAAVLNIIMNILLIPRMGLLAAAVATLVSYAFLVLLMARASFKELPIHVEYGSIAKFLLAGAITVAALWRLDLGNNFVNFVGKGFLSVALYAGIVWFFDPRLRAAMGELWQKGSSGASRAAVAITNATPAAKE
jgi:O-antigen/teichoic acid export membrane protein